MSPTSISVSPGRPGSFRSLLGLTVSGLLVLLGVAALKGSRDLEAARERLGNLETRIQETRRRNQELKRRIELLEDDPATLERLAREELGMGRPSDAVILLPEEP